MLVVEKDQINYVYSQKRKLVFVFLSELNYMIREIGNLSIRSNDSVEVLRCIRFVC